MIILCLVLKIGTPKGAWVNPEGGRIDHAQDWTDGHIFPRLWRPGFCLSCAEPETPFTFQLLYERHP